MSSGNAKIGQPAPQFKATAVVDGQFKDIQLSDYRGVYTDLSMVFEGVELQILTLTCWTESAIVLILLTRSVIPVKIVSIQWSLVIMSWFVGESH